MTKRSRIYIQIYRIASHTHKSMESESTEGKKVSARSMCVVTNFAVKNQWGPLRAPCKAPATLWPLALQRSQGLLDAAASAKQALTDRTRRRGARSQGLGTKSCLFSRRKKSWSGVTTTITPVRAKEWSHYYHYSCARE